MKALAWIALVVVLFGLAIIYTFQDCKKVGHNPLYCILKIDSRGD